VLTASIIKPMSKPRARNWFETWEPVGQGRTLAGPVGKRVRIGLEEGSQWEKGGPQPGNSRHSETSVCFYQTIRCNIPEDILLHTRRRENLKFQPGCTKVLRVQDINNETSVALFRPASPDYTCFPNAFLDILHTLLALICIYCM
jgi:hypothetical protein